MYIYIYIERDIAVWHTLVLTNKILCVAYNQLSKNSKCYIKKKNQILVRVRAMITFFYILFYFHLSYCFHVSSDLTTSDWKIPLDESRAAALPH